MYGARIGTGLTLTVDRVDCIDYVKDRGIGYAI